MKNILTGIMTALLALLAIGAVWAYGPESKSVSVDAGVPDFAFPDKVASNADRQLERALDAGDGAGVVNALVKYALARNAVSPKMLPSVIERIEKVADGERDLRVKSLLLLLEARIYDGLYRCDKWRYDRREIPVDSLAADYTEWSGEQFKKCISSLLDRALEPRDELLASPLKDWESIIEGNEYTYIFYPSLYDMLAYSAIDIYESMARSESILPVRFLEPALVLQPIPLIASVDSYSRQAHDLALDLVSAHEGRPAAQLMARLKAVQCMSALTVDSEEQEYGVDDTYMAIYREYADTEWCVEALIACYYSQDSEYVEALRTAIGRYPDYFRINELKSRLARAEQSSLSYSMWGRCTPGVPFKIDVHINNAAHGAIMLYRDPEGMGASRRTLKINDAVRRSAIKLDVNALMREKPFGSDTVLTVTLDKAGRYFVWAEVDGRTPEKEADRQLICCDFVPLSVGFDGLAYPYAVNSSTGKPMAGVTISGKTYNQRDYTLIGESGADGTVNKAVAPNRSLRLSKDGQVVTSDALWSYHRVAENDWSDHAGFYSSLPLYHHGDSVEWAVVAYRSLNGKHEVLKNKRLTVKVNGANDVMVDSVVVTTDGMGRARGVTRLPADGLSGRFNVVVISNNKVCGWGGFMVNDYKLPTFKVEVTDVRRSVNPDSSIVVSAKAQTYSGFPVGGAKVSLELGDLPRYWWGGTSIQRFWAADSVTAADGTLEVVLPKELLDLSPNGSGRYRLTMNVTSSGGETRTCSQVLSTGKPYTIMADANGDVEMRSPFDPGVEVIDARGNKASIPLKYTVMDDTVKVCEIVGGILPENLEPGVYDIVVAPVDQSLADPQTIDDVTLYRPVGKAPVELPVYIPVDRYEADGDSVGILIGSGVDGANVLVITTVDDRLVSRRWFTPDKGMQRYCVAVPADCRQVSVMFVSVKDNRQYNGTVKIVNNRSVRKLSVVMESFRDKVVPGTPETISLKVNTNNVPSQAAVMMLMESQAILELQEHGLYLNVDEPWVPELTVNNFWNRVWHTVYGAMPSYKWSSIEVPSLYLYGYSFGSSYSRSVKFKRQEAANLNVVREHKAEVTVEEESAPVMMAGMAAGLSVSVAEDGDAGDSLDEVVVTGYGVGKKSAMTGSVSVGRGDTFSYRPSEIPLAFFAPMLSADSTGTVTYTYTVPDANTTWALKALAYTPDMLSASLCRTVVSSRPVMVQATLPRFMRYGDSAVLRATVMNASDSAMAVVTTVSMLDATDMSVIDSRVHTDTLPAGGSADVTIDYKAPSTGQAVIYRVKAQAGDYSDGEQSLLPLLPASQPVITSTPVFVSPDSTTFSMRIPAQGAGNSSSLYLYDNPLWEVVTALPSLREDAATTSIGAMNDIYVASIARGVMARNPELKMALSQWLGSDRSDSTLVSMLSRNDRLKQIALDATPWSRDAMSDNERLTALALMLDDSNIDASIRRGVKTLGKLTMSDGGIAWCAGFEWSSLWATYRVLLQVASLQERGYMPSDAALSRIVNGAVGYIDREMAKRLKADKEKGDYTDYSYIRSIVQGVAHTATSRKAISVTVNNILKRWPGESPSAKATDAVILYHNGYPSMARKLVASIKAYSMHDVTKGTWWEGSGVDVAANILYAIESVTPGDKELIQSVAQWLIMSKTSQSWGCNAATSATIDALLGAIDVERAVKGSVTVTLDGNRVVNDTPQLPGMTVADISSAVDTRDVTLGISKDTGLAVMGSVITRSTGRMDEILSKSHPSVSIEKRVNVVRGTAVEGASTLTVGDRVRIQLIIKVADDLDYVTVVDRQAACLEPEGQLSGYMSKDGLWFYREVTDSETRMYIQHLRRGTYVIDTDMNIVAEGRYTSGVATLQSQINPGVAANSSASPLTVVSR